MRPDRRLPEGKFTYFLLNGDLIDGKEKELATGAGFSLQPYEEIVLEDVDTLLKKKIDTVKRDDVVEVAVQVLQATRRFLAFAIDQKKRVGKDWDAVDDKLRETNRGAAARTDECRHGAAKDWRRADELSIELSNYADDSGAQKTIYRLLLIREMLALDPNRDEDYLKVRDAVNQFENIGGGKGDKDALAARRMLKSKAEQIVKLAEASSKKMKPAEAFNLLKAAEALDPDLKDIRDLRSQWRDRILYVGVPSLPDLMSPTKARTDAERWTLDLLFESLLQAIPDPELGRHYRPMLASRMPDLVPLGREFSLYKNARWADGEGMALDARDVYGTLDMLRKFPAIPCSEELDMIDTDKVRIEDPFRLRLSFRQGVLEPLNRATFKVMPARYLKSKNKDADDDLFARKPFGSGPYRYEGREKDGDREAAVFRANPYYSQRPDKFGLPNIREIRFVVPKPSTVASDFASGQLHVVFDVPVNDLPRYTNDPAVAGIVESFKANVNRRIWMLAINNRRTSLQDVSLRRGISAAIDREKILNLDVFRPGGIKGYHSALTGPFPLNSWATPDKGRKAEAVLFNRDLAAGLFAEAAAKGKVKLSLKYQEGDNLANQACVKIKEQIEEASKSAVEIVLDPVPVAQFFRRIEQEQDFDLAYVPYDYKDDLYSLGSLLDADALTFQAAETSWAYLGKRQQSADR